MSWRVFLDNDNMVTYTLDSKGLSIVRRVNGQDAPDKIRDLDMTSPNAASAYAAQIRIEKNGITIARQDGSPVSPTHDDKHDWSQAKIYVKGDNYFTFWPGR